MGPGGRGGEIPPLRLDPAHWTTWVGVLLAVDLLWYAYHRSSHRIRLLWAAHQAHHNSTYFHYSTAVRQKWNPWFEVLFWTPLPLLGVPPWMIFTAFSVNLVYQFLVHTERVGRLPRPIEFVFNTPSHHRARRGSRRRAQRAAGRDRRGEDLDALQRAPPPAPAALVAHEPLGAAVGGDGRPLVFSHALHRGVMVLCISTLTGVTRSSSPRTS